MFEQQPLRLGVLARNQENLLIITYETNISRDCRADVKENQSGQALVMQLSGKFESFGKFLLPNIRAMRYAFFYFMTSVLEPLANQWRDHPAMPPRKARMRGDEPVGRMRRQLEIWGTKDPNVSAQLVLAMQRNLFQQEAGLDMSFRYIESGTMMPREILEADQPPFAFIQTPISAILLNDRGFPVKIVAPLADIAGTQQLVIHPNCNILHPKDLEGKRIAIAQDAAVYIAISNMARDIGIDLRKIEFVDLLPNEQMKAFMDGDVHAIASWEPWTTNARKFGGQMFFSGVRSEIPEMEGDVSWLVDQACLMVSDAHLQEFPEEIKAILRVLHIATNLINEERKHVVKELAGFFEMTQYELIAAMRKNLYSMNFDNLFRIGLLAFRDFLHHEGMVSRMFTEQELYDTTLLREVAPDLIQFEAKSMQPVSVVERPNVYYRKDISIISDAELRFLVADDSKVVRTSLAQTVDILGGEVVAEATSGQEAIAAFKRLRPNFVTMDLSMPGMSGIDAIKQIFEIAPETVVIVVSGSDLKELREEVFELGVKIFIVKPFDPLLVAEIVGLLLL